MKKIPESITVTVRNGADFRATRPGIRYEGGGMGLTGRDRWTSVRAHFPDTPETPYSLTYSISRRGSWVVEHVNGYRGIVKYGRNRYRGLIVCFLPEEWLGLRVSRKVKKI